MKVVKLGEKAYGPGVFMFEYEAAQIKAALLAYGTNAAKRLAAEIGMPCGKDSGLESPTA